MKTTKILFVFAFWLLVLGVAGCASQPTPTTEPMATEHAYPPPMFDPEEVAASLTAIPDEEVIKPTEEAAVPEPTEEVAAEPAVDRCIECHTNQETLIGTADPVAEVISENEGEG